MMRDLSKIREITEQEDVLLKEFKGDLNKLLSRLKGGREVEIRRLYRILRSLKLIDKSLYEKTLFIVSERLKKIQLGPNYQGKLFIRESQSSSTFYHPKGINERNYLKALEGGFPTFFKGNEGYMYGLYPDIDSTSSAIILLVDAAAELNIFDDEIDEILKRGIKYLEKRDANQDNLLEQYKYEDWMLGIGREGSVLYSNALYLKTLEKVFYLYIDKDREFAMDIQEELLKSYEAIERYFWNGDSYIDSISPRGGLVIRYSIDSVELGDTLIYESQPHIKIHLEKIITVLKEETNWLLRNIYPTITDLTTGKKYLGYNGGIVPYYLAFLSRILIKHGLDKYSPYILADILKYRDYEWVLENTKYSTATSRLENNGEILLTLYSLKRKMEE